MRFEGNWHLCGDGLLRPAVTAYALGAEGDVYEFPLLVDTGADRTVLSYSVITTLGLEGRTTPAEPLEGIGGTAPSVMVNMTFLLARTDGELVPFGGPFRAVADPLAVGLSVIGRDLLNQLAAIVDRPGDVVCLLAGNHRYVIQEF